MIAAPLHLLNGHRSPTIFHWPKCRRGNDLTADLSAYEKIWLTVSRIPFGCVATYGQIARLAGLGKRARMVGYALHRTPDHYDLPWHRVINAQGRISFPPDSEQYKRQRDRLTAENIPFTEGKIDLEQYRWRPGLEGAPGEYFDA